MNPAYLALIEQMGITVASLIAQQKGKDVSGLLSITPVIQAAMTAYNNSLTTLGKAHAEGWAEDDIRWTEQFAGVDAVLDELEKRMT